MKRILMALSLLFGVVAATSTPVSAAPGEVLVITGIVDGPLSGGIPKAIELHARTDIADLSTFGIGSANNGGGSDGEEFTFPAVAVDAGDYIYVATETIGFTSFFGFAPDYTSAAASINGDDAIELFDEGAVVDTFGDINTDGTGQPWEYLDGWAKRTDIATGPDGTTFVLGNWAFSGPNALDGATTNATAGTPFPIGESPGEPPEPPGIELVKIHEIQGTGGNSPLVGQRVIVEGVVVGDEEVFGLRGLFVQEEDSDVDGDPATSEGIFVFTGGDDTASLGDVVQVEGQVQERFGNTQLSDFAVVTPLPDASGIATATELTMPLASLDDLENVEGMAVDFPQTLAISEYFNYDRFGQIVIGLPTSGTDRQFQPTAVYEPGSPEGLALADLNERSRITIDDGSSSQNPSFNVHPIFRDRFTLTNRFRGGDAIGGITGTIYFDFGEHKLYPNGYDSYTENERPTSSPDVGGRLKVATLNTLNYFLTLDNGVDDICGTSQTLECRGADTAEEFTRQRDKLLAALLELDADIVGLVELENTPGVSPLADIVEGLNAVAGEKTYDYIDTGVTGSDAIKVGVIYKPKSVTQIGQTGVLDTPAFLRPNGGDRDRNRPAVAATFLEKGTGEKISIAVNHLKSKGSGCGAGDDDEFAASCNLTRTLAAQELQRWIDTDPTNSKDSDWLILGDLNSYDKEDPIDVLVAAGYDDLLDLFGGEFAYTYVFDGAWGYLDYAMSSASLTSQVTGTAAWHVNADEPDIFDYDTSFKSASQQALYEPNEFRNSDHDAVVVGLDLSQKPGKGNH